MIVAERWGQFLALALVLAGTYAYFYSDIVVRRVGLYVYLAVFTLLWAEMLVIELVAVAGDGRSGHHRLGADGLGRQSPPAQAAPLARSPRSPDGQARRTCRRGPVAGAGRATAGPVPQHGARAARLGPASAGDLQAARTNCGACRAAGSTHVGWLYVVAMFATAVSCRIGAHLYRHTVPWLSSTYFFGTAAATLTGVAGLLSVLGIRAWDELAPLVMIVPILYIIAARLYRGHTQENPLVWVAHAATGVMIAAVLAAAMHLTPAARRRAGGGQAAAICLLAAFFAEAALFYALAAAFRRQGFNVYLGTAMACGAVWQLLQYWQVGAEYYTLTFALLGAGAAGVLPPGHAGMDRPGDCRVPMRQRPDVAVVRGGRADHAEPAGRAARATSTGRSCSCCWRWWR